MIELLENGWFVGIITGIISGMLVFVITNIIINKKSNKEHLHQIIMANNEVISCLKPYIADAGLPEIKVFNAIIASVARRNSVQIAEMYTVHMFCEELIREIIGDVYVSNDKKREYTLSLANYIDINDELTEHSHTNLHYTNYEKYILKVNRRFSIFVSVILSLSTTISVFKNYTKWNNTYIDIDSIFSIGGVITIIISITVLLVSTIIKYIDSMTNNKKKKKKKNFTIFK